MVASTKSLVKLLGDHYFPLRAMARRYPKAAQKKRVVKKWLARFGPDPVLNLSRQTWWPTSGHNWNSPIELTHEATDDR